MARKAKSFSKDVECHMNMTPMIDVVFQLLIFFILVTELQSRDFEKLTLPKAEEAKSDINVPQGRTTINVMKNGDVVIMGNTLTLERLGEVLRAMAEFKMDEEGHSEKIILIRGDREVDYVHVQDVMEKCVQNNIYKISFAAKRSDNEDT